ncbi:MAG: hypothetical protein Q8M93_24855 [Polaromonas sp.]|uniref:hypothetical protein n=1 Tax=Polaromonas sp. TaxID=1869339 RepID=UPI00273118F9|nr:hypothetical protein [Polaromonas sp.]MDP2452269.1 hypothetical protein [Polaromonas sp.]MDP3250180.1 hypothetical protein [Polaromonas sp.]MDP3756672.1 hypothetical protein [Polaromonas sp.]
MSPEQREVAYINSRKLAASQVTRLKAISEIAASGVPVGSAKIVVEVFLALRKGTTVKRALAIRDMDRFLAGIRKDDGLEALAVALNAFARHIVYRESLGSKQPGNRALYSNTSHTSRFQRKKPSLL